MTLHLSSIPGFAHVPDSVLEAEDSASAVALNRINQNAAFGMVRCEFFSGIYADGDTVPLPTSPVDGYVYSRDELIYCWGLYSTFNKDSHWITGPDSLWYAAWLVDQDTGLVSTSEYYRRSSNANPNGQQSHDGQLLVFTIAQRIKNFDLGAVDIDNIPNLDQTNNQAGGNASPLSNILKIVNPSGSYSQAKIFVKAAEIAGQGLYLSKSSLIRTPTGDPTNILEIVPITWNDGDVDVLSLVDGEILSSDPITMSIRTGFDYYAVLVGIDTPFHSGGSVPRAYASSTATGHANASPRFCQLGGDFTSGVSGGFDLSDFNEVYPKWILITEFELSNSGFSLPESFKIIADGEFYQDRPLNTGLITAINRNAKQCIFNTEIISMGEFVDGDVVPKPVSPYDGFVYDYADVIFMHSWRWTTTGSTFAQPALSLGQLDRLNALVDSTGNVDIDVQYYPAHGDPPAHAAGHGRILVTAFCRRGTFDSGSGS